MSLTLNHGHLAKISSPSLPVMSDVPQGSVPIGFHNLCEQSPVFTILLRHEI